MDQATRNGIIQVAYKLVNNYNREAQVVVGKYIAPSDQPTTDPGLKLFRMKGYEGVRFERVRAVDLARMIVGLVEARQNGEKSGD